MLGSCSTIDYQAGPVPGLERLRVEEHFVPYSELFAACTRCGHTGLVIPLACTCIDFRTNRAVIWLVQGAPRATVEHERAHALGYDHTDGDLRRRYTAWKTSLAKKLPKPADADREQAGAPVTTRVASDPGIRRAD